MTEDHGVPCSTHGSPIRIWIAKQSIYVLVDVGLNSTEFLCSTEQVHEKIIPKVNSKKSEWACEPTGAPYNIFFRKWSRFVLERNLTNLKILESKFSLGNFKINLCSR